MKVIFFGTPDFAVPTLEAVAAAHEIVFVVAQPDRPAGRGMKLHKPPVVVRAAELGLKTAQPAKIRDENFHREVEAHQPDIGVVIAYGRILPSRLLEIPRLGFLNVHASLLPKYRGAAPIQRSIQAGDSETGATIMRVDEELDHGPILGVTRLAIGADERLPSVSHRLAQSGAKAMVDVLAQLAGGNATETAQEHSQATHAAKIEKAEGRITFAEPAAEIYNRFRAFDPWPGIDFESSGDTIRVRDMSPAEGDGKPRTLISIGDGVVVATGHGAVRLLELQRPGKGAVAAAEVARNLFWRVGAPIP